MLERRVRKRGSKSDRLGILRTRVYPIRRDVNRDDKRKELIRKIKEGEIG